MMPTVNRKELLDALRFATGLPALKNSAAGWVCQEEKAHGQTFALLVGQRSVMFAGEGHDQHIAWASAGEPSDNDGDEWFRLTEGHKGLAKVLVALRDEEDVRVSVETNDKGAWLTIRALDLSVGLRLEKTAVTFPEDTFRPWTLDPAVFRALPWLYYFTSADPTRPTLQCVLVDARGDKPEVVATETHRLALLTFGEKAEDSYPGSMLIPRDLLKRLSMMVSGSVHDRDPYIAVVGNVRGSSNGGTCGVMWRTVEGPFPTYRNVIPERSGNAFVLPIKQTVDALKFVMAAIDYPKRVVFEAQGGSVFLGTYEHEESVNAECLVLFGKTEGAPPTISLNGEYLLQMLAAHQKAGATTVRMGVREKLDPVVIESVEKTEPELLSLVMPMQG